MIRVRFCENGTFFDRDLPAVPAVGDTVRTYEVGDSGPSLSWVDEVVWDIPSPVELDDPAPVTVQVMLTNRRPKGK